jgi:hypothetical protein
MSRWQKKIGDKRASPLGFLWLLLVYGVFLKKNIEDGIPKSPRQEHPYPHML